ncbi:MAG: hypothetical protein JWQ66_3499 [Mucilaginibacter sp.]|nr:hypothetical protein [Mucilaginibacter sp.]
MFHPLIAKSCCLYHNIFTIQRLYSYSYQISMKSLPGYKFLDILLRKLGFYSLLGWFNR